MSDASPESPLVLASTSVARRRLAARLGHDFVAVAPTCDEHALHGRTPDETARLRAFAKAESVRGQFARTAWIIGSDQLVDLDGRVLGKPGTTDGACAQLAELAGRTHRLITAVVVLGPDVRESRIVVSRMTMRALSAAEIAAYVAADAPEACAGSYKIESRTEWSAERTRQNCVGPATPGTRVEIGGRALFEQIASSDETAIEGLPLVALSGMLAPLYDRALRGGARRPGSPPEASPAP